MSKLIRALLWLIVWSSTFSEAAQYCTNLIPPSASPGRFIDNPINGTVSDTQTKLMWKKCSEGQDFSNNCTDIPAAITTFTWQEALQHVATINANGGFANYTDWRLPNIKELRSIVEQACSDPVIDLAIFPNTPSAEFWSSSPRANSGKNAWIYDFYVGLSDWYPMALAPIYVRLVRNEQ